MGRGTRTATGTTALRSASARVTAPPAPPAPPTPQEIRHIDGELAQLYRQETQLRDKLAQTRRYIISYSGPEYYYRGSQRVTDMTYDQALGILTEALDQMPEGYSDYASLPGIKDSPRAKSVADLIQRVADTEEAIVEVKQQQVPYDETFAEHRWSRFFLVTSSTGHIHRSMSCSTCRPTTRYGWLPDLSGKTEADAVAEHGPALCSVCFPSAPLDWTGSKLTKAAATKASEPV